MGFMTKARGVRGDDVGSVLLVDGAALGLCCGCQTTVSRKLICFLWGRSLKFAVSWYSKLYSHQKPKSFQARHQSDFPCTLWLDL